MPDSLGIFWSFWRVASAHVQGVESERVALVGTSPRYRDNLLPRTGFAVHGVPSHNGGNPSRRLVKCSDVYTSDSDESATSTRLLREARACDPVAWERLVAVYSRRMYRWCRRAGLQAADAANVVQEAFAAIARKLDDFHRDRPGDSFRGWLRTIVDNKIRDHYRRLGRRHDAPIGGTDAHRLLVDLAESEETDATDTPAAAATPATNGPLAEIAAAVRAEIGERNWTFFWRTAVDGQSAAEVGQEFGVTANTVRIVKMRVLRRLREQWDVEAIE